MKLLAIVLIVLTTTWLETTPIPLYQHLLVMAFGQKPKPLLFEYSLISGLNGKFQITNKLHEYIRNDSPIIDGVGFGTFEIGKTQIEEVVKVLGNEYEEIIHKRYSIEIYYRRLGVSFYYYQGDDSHELFAIHFQAPFKGKTRKGISLNESTMEDVILAYGEPEWTSCKSCNTWAVEYEGIKFFVERETQLPHFPLEEEVHLEKTVVEITVIEN